MILEASEFIKIIKELRSEKSYNDVVQDDINKINEKIIKEYDKTLKNSLNSQKELSDKIKKLETDKHNLIEENKRLEEQLSNLEYCEKELKEAREQIELNEQQNQSYRNIICDLKNEIKLKEETFIDNVNKHNNTVKTLIDEKNKLKSEIAFFKINNNVNFREENEKLKEDLKIVENINLQLNSIFCEISSLVVGEEGYMLKQIQEILNKEVK